MFKLLLILSISVFSIAAKAELELVDIGFKDFNKHIAIELTTLNGEDALKFRLASNLTGKSVEISKCVYTQSSLEREVAKIQDTNVRADFRWIFLRSDYAATPVSQFFPEFKALLER